MEDEHEYNDKAEDLDELFERLERTEELAKENNQILRGMRRKERMETFFRILRLVFIALVLVALYYFAQPYIAQMQDVIEVYRDGIENI